MTNFEKNYRALYSNSRALVIGINDYKEAPKLNFAVNDAEAVREAVVNTLGFDEKNVDMLLNEQATRDNIRRKFHSYSHMNDSIEVDDRILFFFAGHGFTADARSGSVGFLIPYDAESGDECLSTYIRWDELTKCAEMIRAKHVLFIMDACYSGLALTRSAAPGSSRFVESMMKRYSRQVLTAGKSDEVVSDSGGPRKGHSVFTGHLLDGIEGKAESAAGLITANSLMSYVYSRVGQDPESTQTPQYGHVAGEGDFMLKIPKSMAKEEGGKTGSVTQYIVPYIDADVKDEETTKDKVRIVKELMSDSTKTIQLHDFVIEHVQEFLAISTDSEFSLSENTDPGIIQDRIRKYEAIIGNLVAILVCIGHWGSDQHLNVLSKAFSRLADNLGQRAGSVFWSDLRWYPILLCFYATGVAAINSKNYAILKCMFESEMQSDENTYQTKKAYLAISSAALTIDGSNAVKQFPEHQKHHVPLSERLFAVLQPVIDDAIYVGKGYEESFDQFEIFFALCLMHYKRSTENDAWVNIGRYGWKHCRGHNSPVERYLSDSLSVGQSWLPLQFDFFAGIAAEYQLTVTAFRKFVGTFSFY